MKYCLPQNLKPSEKTLQVIRQFARAYKPAENVKNWMSEGVTAVGIA